ncbi:6,7-dimethyl-8-ribityllumazine synthase [Kalaharituber pfeilii]|nr:6,7-dimethyl-8-ribityllumazine synthase [Kalaharituber pfeilii]
MFTGTKGPGQSQAHDGSNLRVLIVHARWNSTLIAPLCLYVASQIQAASANPSSSNLLGAIIAIGVLIKGDTVHFEHIAESVSKGLMRVQLDHGVPVIFGLLTVLKEDQAKKRAGLTEDGHNYGRRLG